MFSGHMAAGRGGVWSHQCTRRGGFFGGTGGPLCLLGTHPKTHDLWQRCRGGPWVGGVRRFSAAEVETLLPI